MGSFNDLKKKQYFGFISWLDQINVGDCFSNDAWGAIILTELYEKFKEGIKGDRIINNFIDKISLDDLKKILKQKEEKEKEKDNGKKIIKPDLKTIQDMGNAKK